MGTWVTPERALFKTSVLTCRLCGKMIPHRYWHVDEGELSLDFCDPECERLYREYWVPRHCDAQFDTFNPVPS